MIKLSSKQHFALLAEKSDDILLFVAAESSNIKRGKLHKTIIFNKKIYKYVGLCEYDSV